MIIERKVFQYQDRNLIEKAIIQTPFRYERVFHNEGCFLYLKANKAQFLSSKDKINTASKEAVLLQCDTYFVDFLKKKSEETVEVIAIHLYPDILKKLYIHELPSLIEKQYQNKKSKLIADGIVISKFIESLDFYFENPTLINDDILELKIKELVLLLIQTNNVESVLALVKDLYSTRTKDLRAIVNLHLYSNLSIEQLAKLCNRSISSFKRAFKTAFNDSPSNFINAAKIKKAKELLRLSDHSISDIAYEVGFNDPHYFTRIFKKREGVPPRTYRADSNRGTKSPKN